MFAKGPVGAALLAFAIVVVACGGAETTETAPPLNIPDYVGEINAITLDFEETGSRAAELDLPVDGDLANASALFVAYDHALEVMRTLAPPPEVAAQHEALVDTLAELQDTVLAYLQKASLEGDFEFPDISADPDISIRLSAFDEACIGLGDALRDLGAQGVPTVCSQGG